MKDKDKLKGYFQDNRDGFDDLEPTSELWEKIEKELKPEGRKEAKVVQFNWWRAAAVLFMVCTFGLAMKMFLFNDSSDVKTTIASYEIPSVNNDISFDQVNTEKYYFQVIDEKRKEINELGAPESISEAYDKELKDLLIDYKSLKTQLEANPGNEQLIQALVKNLKLQIDLLNEQLTILNNYKSYENENNENYTNS
ncbi:hypothetical protein [Marinigracilibium pacificum]|uniref:Anti-sigma factor n=1 Tax=Marinigracilibium pacificum TaxID=2729599 RepID=A0A848J7Z5_9BACT|nr:hypothetical protein [Marinigracilibium pacificum]NMM50610.1 hypothetical protein [Marinigracilibium pacificum]